MTALDKLEHCRRYMEDEEWHPQKNEQVNKDFVNSCLTRTQRYVMKWGEKIDERIEFMSDTAYSEGTVAMLETMMKNNKAVTESYQLALATLYKEEEEQTFGAITESAAEMGLFDNI